MAVFCFPAFLTKPEGREFEVLAGLSVDFQPYSGLCPYFSEGLLTELERNELTNQQFTYLYSCALAEGLMANTPPDALTGVSMGLYAALVSAGCLTLTDGFRLVNEAYRLASEAVAEIACGMVSVIGLKEMELLQLVDSMSDSHSVTLVNCNGKVSFLLAGTIGGVQELAAMAQSEGALKVHQLNVTAPYHTPLLQSCMADFEAIVQNTVVASPRYRVYSAIDGRLLTDVAMVRDELVRNLTTPLNWHATMEKLISKGFTDFYECGAGTDLYRISKFIEGNFRFRPFYRLPLIP